MDDSVETMGGIFVFVIATVALAFVLSLFLN